MLKFPPWFCAISRIGLVGTALLALCPIQSSRASLLLARDNVVDLHVSMVSGMLTIRRILFPVDFSAQSHAAAPFAGALASRFDAQLIILSVVPIPALRGFEQPTESALIDAEALKHDLEPRLDGAFRKEFATLEVERVVELGDAATAIARYADTQGVDLIMMPTRGEGPARRLLLGSVTAKVLHDAQCPVWTRVHTDESPLAQRRVLQTVRCAIGRTPESTLVMQWAAEFAEKLGAALKLVHVIPAIDGWSPSLTELTAVKDEARRTIESLQRHAGVTASSMIVYRQDRARSL